MVTLLKIVQIMKSLKVDNMNLKELNSRPQRNVLSRAMYMIVVIKLIKKLVFFFYVSCLVIQGEVVCELYWKHAPKTCRNFTELVSS